LVSTRLVIVFGSFISFLAFSLPWLWLFLGGNLAGVYGPFDFAGALGNQYGPCSCPSSTPTPVQVVVPLLVKLTPLAVGGWVFPFAFVFALLSIWRWNIMLVSGALHLVAGVSWVLGTVVEGGYLSSTLDRLEGLSNTSTSYSFSLGYGPYAAIFVGLLLTLGYILSKRDVLVRPTD